MPPRHSHRRDHHKPERAKAKQAMRRLDNALNLVQKVYEDIRDGVLVLDPPDSRHVIEIMTKIVAIAAKLGADDESGGQ